MADVSFLIFQSPLALSPDRAGALLDANSLSDAETVSSLAALQAGLQMEGEVLKESRVLHDKLDGYMQAVIDGRPHAAYFLRKEIAREIPKIPPDLFSRAVERIGRPSFSKLFGTAAGAGAEKILKRRPSPFCETIPVSLLPLLSRLAVDSPFRLQRKADRFRRLGSKEEAAYLYGLSAKAYAGRRRFSMSARLYFSEGKIRLELGQWVAALVAFGRARTSRLMMKKDERAMERILQHQEQVIKGATVSGALGATRGEIVIYLFSEAAKAHQKAKEIRLEAENRFGLSAALLELQDPARAFKEASRAAVLFSHVDRYEFGHALAQKAKSLSQMRGESKKVAAIYKEAASVFAVLGETRWQADMLELAAHAFFDAGEYRNAAKGFGRVFAFYHHTLFDTQKSDQMWDLRLRSLEKGGLYKEALGLWIEEAKRKEGQGDRKTKAEIYCRMARLWEKMGEPERAVLFYKGGSEIYLALNAREEAAMAYGLGSLIDKGLWKKGVEIVYAAGDKGGGATLGLMVGNLLKRTEDWAQAAKMYRLAIRGFEAMGDQRLAECRQALAECLKNLRAN